MVAIILPPPNFFLALGKTLEISGGALEPESLLAAGTGDCPTVGLVVSVSGIFWKAGGSGGRSDWGKTVGGTGGKV